MRSVAFFRNLNQGQRGCPTSATLDGAFAAAGASGIDLFQSDGTVVFSAHDPVICVEVAAKAVRRVFHAGFAASDCGAPLHDRD
ncbi:MAG: hypothetical protein ABI238_01115 [Terrimesophilobacter sp.]